MIYVAITIAALLYYVVGWVIIMLIYWSQDYEPIWNVFTSPDREERFMSCARVSLVIAFVWPLFILGIGVLLAFCAATFGIDDFFKSLYARLHGKKK